MYGGVYKWFTETSGLGLSEQARKLRKTCEHFDEFASDSKNRETFQKISRDRLLPFNIIQEMAHQPLPPLDGALDIDLGARG